MVVSMPRPPDGRDVAFSASVLVNDSETEPAAPVAAELIEASGLTLVGAFTVDMDRQIAVGQEIPPDVGDWGETEADIANAEESIRNWADRLPLDESVVGPGGALQLVLVLRPTEPDDCVSAKGFKLRYKEFGRTYSVDSNLAMIVYKGEDPDVCEEVDEYIRAHPLR
jgi:hypothetical protein